MTQEERELLLKDLCGRLPYETIIRNYVTDEDDVLTYSLLEDFEIIGLEYIKPYLRPMSSMTEEEGKELEHLLCEIDFPGCVDTTYGCVTFAGDNDFIGTEIAEVYTDWLNKKMFDYRGLIPMGIALPAPEGMYK